MKCFRACAKPILSAVTVLTLACCICQAAEFSADEVVRADFSHVKDKKLRDKQATVFRSRLYVKGNLERRDYWKMVNVIDRKTGKHQVKPQTNRKPDKTIIGIPSKGITWTINPREKTYTESCSPARHHNDLFRGWKQVGEQLLNGYKCKKYLRSLDVGSETFTTTWWWSTKLDYGIRSETVASDGSLTTWELTNIVLKRLPDSLFRPPKGYRKVACVDKK